MIFFRRTFSILLIIESLSIGQSYAAGEAEEIIEDQNLKYRTLLVQKIHLQTLTGLITGHSRNAENRLVSSALEDQTKITIFRHSALKACRTFRRDLLGLKHFYDIILLETARTKTISKKYNELALVHPFKNKDFRCDAAFKKRHALLKVVTDLYANFTLTLSANCSYCESIFQLEGQSYSEEMMTDLMRRYILYKQVRAKMIEMFFKLVRFNNEAETQMYVERMPPSSN